MFADKPAIFVPEDPVYPDLPGDLEYPDLPENLEDPEDLDYLDCLDYLLFALHYPNPFHYKPTNLQCYFQ